MKSCTLVCTLLATICLFAGSAFAETKDASQLTPAELQALFESQRTRGLVIAPANNADGQVNPDQTAIVPADQYAKVDADLQVNVRISFDFDSAALKVSEKGKLTSLCHAVKSSDIPVFRIVGHTDASGSASYNQNLSLLRAEEVKRYMVAECGIPEAKLLAVGVGEDYPVDAADPRADANRRVEFQVAS